MTLSRQDLTKLRDKLNMYHYISTTTVSTKLGRMVNCLEELLAQNSHDTLIAWFYEITWKIKIIISTIPQCLRPPNLVELWLNLRDLYLFSHMAHKHKQPFCKTRVGQNTLSFATPALWNKIPEEIKRTTSLNTFK